MISKGRGRAIDLSTPLRSSAVVAIVLRTAVISRVSGISQYRKIYSGIKKALPMQETCFSKSEGRQ